MRTTVFLLLLAMVVSGACKKKGNTCPPDIYTYAYKNNAQVDTLRNALTKQLAAIVNTGSKRVFTYQWSPQSCVPIADGPGGVILVFEADPDATHFKYTTDSLLARKCYYYYPCGECLPPTAAIPIGGTIEGTKVSDKKWKVDIDVKTYNSLTINSSADFARAN
ncbi:MAG TPA: hypothetical protein VLD19_12310 [Chitinophagaceae bacterium]|nr:hypothetical protein [Chitinophagaceae bacterium]